FADASRIDPRLKGAGEIAALLAGPLNNPEGAVEIRAARMSAIGKPVRDLNIRLEARELLGALRGKLTLAGNIDGRPLKGGGDIFKKDGGGWRIAALDASLGSAKIGGEAEVGASGATNGRLSVNAPDLGQLSALALTQMRGSLQADITLAASGGRQNAQVKAQARSLVFQDIRIGAARADISATDLLTRPQLSGNIHAEQLRAGGESIGKLDVMAKGSGTTTDFTARTSGGSIVFNAAGALRNGAPMVLSLKSFSGSRRGVRVALASPATLQIANGGVSMKSLTLNAAGGQVTVSGTAGQKLNIKLNVARLPLSVAKAFDPKLNFAGTLNASADLRGAADNPQGPYTIAIDRFASSETRSSGLPPLTIRLGGQLQGKRATVKGSVRGGPKINVALDGAVPLASRGALALAIGGTVDGSLANAALTEGGQRVTGQINLNLSVRGDAAKPAIAGSATLSNGTFRDPLQGVALTAVNGRFSGRGDRLTIDTLSGRTPNGGTVSVSGSVSMDGTQGFPADLRIGASKAQLVSNDIMTLVAGLDLTVTGALVRDPAVRGRIDIRSLNVSIPERLPASAAPLRGAKHIAPPPQTRARLKAIAAAKRAAARRKRARGGGGPRIDIRIDAPSQVFVRGRGVDAELGGSLTVTGTANAPRANGAFELRRGKIDLLTQRVDFSRGRLTFLGDIVPELDFVATSSISGVTAKVNLAGRADDPKITFSSEPAMASDEVLSYLLFQKAAASLKPFEAVQLAAAVATLTGNGGPGFLDKARRALGVDTLDISAGGKDGPAVGASRYISRRISVGARAGTTPANSAATVKVDVTRRIKLLGEVTGDGRSRVGIGTEIEY
ncbi:MAG: translocation/assembly module TamB domain-containing protein, partial [Beijerinckiaceae bacterium]